MKNIYTYKFILLLLVNFSLFSQDRKIALAQRVSSPPVIDGILDDGSWSNAEINTDFFMIRPSNNGSARETHSTQVKVIYDDEAVYFGVKMLDPDYKNIAKEISQRDEFYMNKTDFIMVSICLLLIGVTLTPIYVMQLILRLFRYTSVCISWVLEKIILSLNLITEYYGTLIVSLRNKK